MTISAKTSISLRRIRQSFMQVLDGRVIDCRRGARAVLLARSSKDFLEDLKSCLNHEVLIESRPFRSEVVVYGADEAKVDFAVCAVKQFAADQAHKRTQASFDLAAPRGILKALLKEFHFSVEKLKTDVDADDVRIDFRRRRLLLIGQLSEKKIAAFRAVYDAVKDELLHNGATAEEEGMSMFALVRSSYGIQWLMITQDSLLF